MLKVKRTALAPSQEEGEKMAQEAFGLIEKLGVEAKVVLEQMFKAKVVLHWGETTRFHRVDHLDTGGTTVTIWHPTMPKPIGTCDYGKFHAGGACGEDSFFEIPAQAKKNFAHPDKINFYCPRHQKLAGL